MAHAMHPNVLDDLGLPSALEWLSRKTEEHTSLRVALQADASRGIVALRREPAAALYRVAQESIRNVERHAGARRVHVTLALRADSVALEIVDDGCGFDLREASARRPGMGLFAMRERMALVNGDLAIFTAPGRGTRVRATAPAGSGEPPPLPLVTSDAG